MTKTTKLKTKDTAAQGTERPKKLRLRRESIKDLTERSQGAKGGGVPKVTDDCFRTMVSCLLCR